MVDCPCSLFLVNGLEPLKTDSNPEEAKRMEESAALQEKLSSEARSREFRVFSASTTLALFLRCRGDFCRAVHLRKLVAARKIKKFLRLVVSSIGLRAVCTKALDMLKKPHKLDDPDISYSALASYLCSPDVKREMQRAFFLIFKLKTRKSKSITAKSPGLIWEVILLAFRKESECYQPVQGRPDQMEQLAKIWQDISGTCKAIYSNYAMSLQEISMRFPYKRFVGCQADTLYSRLVQLSMLRRNHMSLKNQIEGYIAAVAEVKELGKKITGMKKHTAHRDVMAILLEMQGIALDNRKGGSTFSNVNLAWEAICPDSLYPAASNSNGVDKVRKEMITKDAFAESIDETFWHNLTKSSHERDRKGFLDNVINVCRYLFNLLESMCTPFFSEDIQTLNPSRIRKLIRERTFGPPEKKAIILAALKALSGLMAIVGKNGTCCQIAALGNHLSDLMSLCRKRGADDTFCFCLRDVFREVTAQTRMILEDKELKSIAAASYPAISHNRSLFYRGYAARKANMHAEEIWLQKVVYTTKKQEYLREMEEGNMIMGFHLFSRFVLDQALTAATTKDLPVSLLAQEMRLKAIKEKFDYHVLAAVMVMTANMQALPGLQTDKLSRLAVEGIHSKEAMVKLLRFCPNMAMFESHKDPSSKVYKIMEDEMMKMWTFPRLNKKNYEYIKDHLNLENPETVASKLLLESMRRNGMGDGGMPEEERRQNLADAGMFQLFCKGIFLVHGKIFTGIMSRAALSMQVD